MMFLQNPVLSVTYYDGWKGRKSHPGLLKSNLRFIFIGMKISSLTKKLQSLRNNAKQIGHTESRRSNSLSLFCYTSYLLLDENFPTLIARSKQDASIRIIFCFTIIIFLRWSATKSRMIFPRININKNLPSNGRDFQETRRQVNTYFYCTYNATQCV